MLALVDVPDLVVDAARDHNIRGSREDLKLTFHSNGRESEQAIHLPAVQAGLIRPRVDVVSEVSGQLWKPW